MSDDPDNTMRQSLGWSDEAATAQKVTNRNPWWRTGEAATGAGGVALKAAIDTDVVSASEIDIGQELEEEARLRVASNAVDQLVEIYPKPELANERMLKATLWASGFVVVTSIVQAILAHDPWALTLIPIFLVECAVIGRIISRITARRTKPVLVLSRAGIEINTPMQHIVLLKWDEIEEIGSFHLGEHTIGIVPKDIQKLCKRIPPGEAFCMRANCAFARMFPESARKYFAPIFLTQQVLPITPEEVLGKIEKFRLENNV